MTEASPEARDAKRPETGQEAPHTAALSRDEMIVILEEIARDGSDTARIQAIKTLLRLQDGSDDVGDDDLDKLIQAN
jgi:hypothetical protein